MVAHRIRLSDDQRTLLEVAYAAFRQEARWPTYQYVDKALDVRGMNLHTTLHGLPEGLLRPLGSGGAIPQAGEDVRLTLAGVAQGGGLSDVELFIRVLQWLVEQERVFRPAVPSTAEELRVSSSDIQRAVGHADQPSDDALARLRLLIETEPAIYTSMRHPEGPRPWDLTVSSDIRRYREVHTVDDYLERLEELDVHEQPQLVTSPRVLARREALTAGLYGARSQVDARLSGLHAEVLRVASALFLDGHLANAIFEAFKVVEVRVHALSGLQGTGRDLMARAFRETKPALPLNRGKTEIDQDEQEGFKLIFMGAMQGIRNPKAHGHVVQEDEDRTLDYLHFASLLMHRLDNAEAMLRADGP